MNQMGHFSTLFALIVLAAMQTGCAVLVGNVKPVSERSDSYGVMDLSTENPQEWVKLPASQVASDQELSDVAYQSRKTNSIISLNSSCRPSIATDHTNLRNYSNLLLMGISAVTLREEKDVSVLDIQALEITVKGQVSGSETMLRSVVLRHNKCIYDLMYVSRPDKFHVNEADFIRFIASLKLK